MRAGGSLGITLDLPNRCTHDEDAVPEQTDEPRLPPPAASRRYEPRHWAFPWRAAAPFTRWERKRRRPVWQPSPAHASLWARWPLRRPTRSREGAGGGGPRRGSLPPSDKGN